MWGHRYYTLRNSWNRAYFTPAGYFVATQTKPNSNISFDRHLNSTFGLVIIESSGKPAKPFQGLLMEFTHLCVWDAAHFLFSTAACVPSFAFNLLGGSLKRLEPQGRISTSCPRPRRSIWSRVNCRALKPSGRFFARTRWAKANSPQATCVGSANLSAVSLVSVC
jgi:hypothetical protein